MSGFEKAQPGAGEPFLALSLVKRDARQVPFDPAKIETAVGKALAARGYEPANGKIIADRVTRAAVAQRRSPLHIEEVQDLVLEELMKAGIGEGEKGRFWFKIAEAYILYRASRSAIRASGKTRSDQSEFIEVHDGATVSLALEPTSPPAS